MTHPLAAATASALIAGVIGVFPAVAAPTPPPATFAPAIQFGAGAAPSSLATGDLNGDAQLDLVVVNYSGQSVSVLLGDGTGGFGPDTEYPNPGDPYALALGDLDGDGLLDLLVTSYLSDSLSVRLGDGAGGFGARADHPVGDGPYAVAVGELDGDAHPDVAVANLGADTVSILLGDGSGGLGTRTDVTSGINPSAVALVDLNGDAARDLVVANYGSSTVSVRLGDGAGGFGGMSQVSTTAGPYSMTLVDLNGDALLDVVTSSYLSTDLSVRLGDGAGGFGSLATIPAGGFTISVAVGDLDGDAIPDLVAASSYTGTVAVLTGDGAGGFGDRTVQALGPSTPRMVIVADLRSDGRPDLATTNYYASPTVSVLLNTTGDPGGAVTVTPHTDLVDGQSVDIQGSGWTPGHTVGFCQAVVFLQAGPDDCADGAHASVVIDATGAFDASLVVHGAITVPSLGRTVDCADPIDLPCVVGAADTADVSGTAVTAALQFRPPLPTVPSAPTIIRNATAAHQSATVSWAPPGSTGGSPITGYLVTPYVGFFPLPTVTFESTATTQIVTGLRDGTGYRFRVAAINAVGTGPYSKVTNEVTPAPTAPTAPTIIRTATAGDRTATVSWSAPASDGGAPVSAYVVTPYRALLPLPAQTFGSTATTQTVTGLTNGLEYRFRVQATNALGTGPYSKVTNPVTPSA